MAKDNDQQLDALLDDAKRQSWRAERGKRYFKLLCPCSEKHIRLSVHLTPSDPHYWLNLRKWLLRNTCWREDP